jgi:RNA polymerase sigma factor (sigma-70 family)
MIGSGKANGDGSGRSASDAELVLAVRRGDKRAFVEIVARHQAMVCGIALAILGDFAASEDAGQEAFLTAWRKFHELRDPGRLRAWLGQIARNAALGHVRRRRGDVPLDDNLELVDGSLMPDEVTANQDEANLVRDSLAKLPETYRLPLVLFYREGQSVRAVAEALEISEDAVKQRLARGREMLRDRMSGMIETVLTRTGPNAVFTMAIAAAIGALAAPAVMAGTIFAAASSTSTTASTTSLLTIMSTSKTLLVTTALVAVVCIPIGYQLSSGRQTTVGTGTLAETNAVTKLVASNAVPNFEGSALFAEWRELHNKYGTNAQAMPAIFNAIAEMKDAFRRRAFRAALVSEWVQVDPMGGLAFFMAKGSHSEQRQQFFEEWLACDARAAVDALMTSKSGWEEMARSCLSEIARRMPSRVAEIASRLPKAESYWDTNVRDAFGVLAERDLGSARKAAEGVTGPSREQALSGVARMWAKSDMEAAIAWAKKLPEGADRDEVIRAALMGRAAVDPVGALELVGTVPSGGRHAYSTTTTGARVLSQAANADFDATLAFVTAHPGRFSRADMEGLNVAVTERLNADAAGFLTRCAGEGSLTALLSSIDTALLNNASGQRTAIWEWLKKQPETEGLKELRQSVLRGAGYQDPGLALRFVGDLPANAEGDSQLKDLARALFNGGSRLHRFESVFDQAPERLRQPLLDTAYEYLNAGNLDDPQRWIDRLSLLPEGSRTRGIESIARAWTQQSPEEAIGWASSLPTGAARNGVLGAIATSWAKQDAYGAADWVDSLPPGGERDHSAGSLVFAVADKFPREAWQWALSIGDDLERSRAAAHAAQMMAARDLETARQWVQAGPFTPEVKAQLEADLERRSRSASNAVAP